MRISLLFILVHLNLFASINSLAQDAYWKKLLHFDGNKTYVINDNFYFSKDRPLTLQNELNATIVAFRGKDSATMICKYPARYIWLKSYVPLPDVNLSQCHDLNKFYQLFDKERVCLVTKIDATGELASLMGHTMLIFKNDEDSFDSAKIIDFSFNTDDNSSKFMKYTGAFIGQFPMSLGYKEAYKYINTSVYQGDVLKFSKIDITPLQKNMIIYHAYELQNIEFAYYYLHNNCTTHINELLSLMNDSKYIVDKSSIPIETQIIYNKYLTDYAYLTLDDYRMSRLLYWDEYTSEKKRKMIKEFSSSMKHNAVKKLNFFKNKIKYTGYMRNPSSVQFMYLNDNSFEFSYKYYDKNLIQNELETDIKTKALNISLRLNDGKYSIKEITLFELYVDQYISNRSYYIYLGIDRLNKNNKLVLHNELGYGINYQLDKIKIIARLNIGHKNDKLYLQPNIVCRTNFSNKQILELSYLHDYGQSNYFSTSIDYIYRYNKYYEIGLNFLNDASIYKDSIQVGLKLYF